jgi:hypothetical protein
MTVSRLPRWPACGVRSWRRRAGRGRWATGAVTADRAEGVAAGRRPHATRVLSRRQVEAIGAIMRLFVEDDLANGVSDARRLYCGACARSRPAPGFVRYSGADLCNPCATAYEIARARGLVRTIGEYLDTIRARPGG